MKPILKWVGGKSQLLPEIRTILPADFGRFFEPFLGGGALFFNLERPGAMVSDLNPRLINFYKTVSVHSTEVLKEINSLGVKFDSLDSNGKKQHFYELREEFNGENASSIRSSALFYYLNKTGFNGLFRENSKGEFNVPFGQKSNFAFPDTEAFHLAGELLATATISYCGYAEAVTDAGQGDVVYFDPPYVPLDGSPSFTSYLSNGFGPAEQATLAETFRSLAERGAYVIASNSYTESVRRLYSDFNVSPIKARRNINSNGAGRGTIDEALITSF